MELRTDSFTGYYCKFSFMELRTYSFTLSEFEAAVFAELYYHHMLELVLHEGSSFLSRNDKCMCYVHHLEGIQFHL